MNANSPFGDLHIPKRRRTSLGRVRNQTWSSGFSGYQLEDLGLQNDEFEVAQTLGMLAAGAAFAQDDPELQEGESEAFEAGTESESNRPLRRQGSHKRRSSPYSDEDWPEKERKKGIFQAAQLNEDSESEPDISREARHRSDLIGRLGPYNNALSGAPAYSSVHQAESGFKGSNSAAPNGMTARAESFPLLKATFVPGQTLNENHAYKRCASHVYIARFIEYQTNKSRQQQQQQQQHQQQQQQQHLQPQQTQRAMNGYAHAAPDRMERAGGAFHKPALPVMQDPSSNMLANHANMLPQASMSHPYLTSQHFPAAPLPSPNPVLQGLPPYAHLLAQQQQQQQQNFPFIPGYNGPGLHFNGQAAQQQQVAAQALALSGILPPLMQSAFPNSSSLPLKHGPVSSTSALTAPLAAPTRVKVEPSVQQRHPNGNGIKQEDTAAALLRMGFPPQAMGPNGLVDLERLKSMYPGLLEQPLSGPNPNAILDGLKHHSKAMQMPPDQWSNPSKHVKL